MRRSLFRKYFLVLFASVIFPMAASEISNTWFSYLDQRAILTAFLRSEATSAADQIESFLDSIKFPLGSTIPQDGSAMATVKQLRLLALRAMHQVPGILSISLVDGAGVEQLYISRTGLNRTKGGADRSGDPAVVGATTAKVWCGPVTYRQGSEPSITMAMANYDDSVVVNTVVAEISLKPIWLIVSDANASTCDCSTNTVHPAAATGALAVTTRSLPALRPAIAMSPAAAIASRNPRRPNAAFSSVPCITSLIAG